MRSDNHSLFARTKEAYDGKALAGIKLIATREMWNLALARGPFCKTSVLHVIPSWTGANEIAHDT